MVVMIATLTCVAAVLLLIDEIEEDVAQSALSEEQVMEMMRTIMSNTINFFRLYKCGRVDETGAPIPKRRRIQTNFNWDRAQQCVWEDFISPTARFNDRQFERTFRVTRAIVEETYLIAANADPFFRDTFDVVKQRQGICPQVKILFALQQLAFAVSPSALWHYYQMGETTAREAMKRLAHVVANSPDLCERFFRTMTQSDAMKTSDLHYRKHGVAGMVGSIDCMHLAWKNCPIAWQGSHKGKEKKPTLVLEAMADHNLFIWHASFGWPGTLNDINVWEGSPLYRLLLDGTWGEFVDFEYQIGEFTSSKLFFLVDGIYPELSRFVKPFGEPVGRRQTKYTNWQEAARKDIERTFGVLQRKFHILVKAIELWFKSEIKDIVSACIIFHNWMVTHRINNDEREEADHYTPAFHDPVNAERRDEDEIVQMLTQRTDVNREAALGQLFTTVVGLITLQWHKPKWIMSFHWIIKCDTAAGSI
jgi:Plant transposon protein